MNTPSVDLSLAPPEHSRVGTIIAVTFLSLASITAAVFVSLAAIKMLEQQDALTNWPTTEGMVSEVSADQVINGVAAPATGQLDATYIPIIRHFYTVDGVNYVGTRATPLNSDGTMEWVTDIVGGRNYGDPLTVYYNPADHSQSFVVRYWDDSLILVALFASFFPCFIAFLVTASGLRKYTLKWTLPAIATAVYAIALATCAGIYFGIVPRQDITQRAIVVFMIASALLLVAMWMTLTWRNQHLDWRRTQSRITNI